MDNTVRADSSANNSNRWPSVRGPLPTRTPDLLGDTSLTPPVHPLSGPTTFQRHQQRQAQQRARQERQRIREEAQGHAAVREWREKQTERTEKANKAWDKLDQYQAAEFQRTWRRFANALTAWKAGMQSSWQGRAVFAAFEAHMQYAMRASPVEVRRCDIISWFKIPERTDGLADDLTSAAEGMVEYCHKEAALNSTHHVREFLASSTSHETCEPDQACSIHIDFALVTEKHFGWEGLVVDEALRPHSFAGYPKDITSVEDTDVLRANFEVRKVRLDHAVKESRYGVVSPGNDEDWEISIDGQTSAFINAALAASSRNGIKEAVRSELEAYTDVIDMEAEAEARATNLALALAQLQSDMTSYQIGLTIRKSTINTTRSRLKRMNRRLLHGPTGLTSDDFQASIYDARTYRTTVLQGVDMGGPTVPMPFQELMRVIGEDDILR